MIGNPYRYQVQWQSAVTGKHCDPRPSEEAARERLAEVREREHFEWGVIIDTQLQSMGEFQESHAQFHEQQMRSQS